MMNIVIVSKYILKLRIKHKQLEHVVIRYKVRNLSNIILEIITIRIEPNIVILL